MLWNRHGIKSQVKGKTEYKHQYSKLDKYRIDKSTPNDKLSQKDYQKLSFKKRRFSNALAKWALEDEREKEKEKVSPHTDVSKKGKTLFRP